MFPFREDCLAACDIEEACRFYETKAPGLGRRFTAAVADAYEKLAANPELHSRLVGDIRRCRVQGFPYSVLFHFDGTEITILVVTNLHRSPGWWKTRIPPDFEN